MRRDSAIRFTKDQLVVRLKLNIEGKFAFKKHTYPSMRFDFDEQERTEMLQILEREAIDA